MKIILGWITFILFIGFAGGLMLTMISATWFNMPVEKAFIGFFGFGLPLMILGVETVVLWSNKLHFKKLFGWTNTIVSVAFGVCIFILVVRYVLLDSQELRTTIIIHSLGFGVPMIFCGCFGIKLSLINPKSDEVVDSVENGKFPVCQETVINKDEEKIALIYETVPEIEKVDISENTDKEDAIEKFLSSKNIKIKFVPPEDAADDIINSLAEFLGNNYTALTELLAKIKSSMQTGGFITLAIKDYPQKDISAICQFCTLLHEIAFLEEYRYFKSPQFLIRAKTTRLPKAQNFFSGKWLERFVLQTVQKSVNTVSSEIGKKLDFSYLINPQIILPNGNDFELDLIFHVNKSFYWIEAKTSDFQQHINKYSNISKKIELNSQHSIMVLPNIQPEKSSALTSLFSMTVYGLPQLKIGLIDAIRKDLIS